MKKSGYSISELSPIMLKKKNHDQVRSTQSFKDCVIFKKGLIIFCSNRSKGKKMIFSSQWIQNEHLINSVLSWLKLKKFLANSEKNLIIEYLYQKVNSNYHTISWETLKIFPLRCRAGQGNPSLLLNVVLKVLVNKVAQGKNEERTEENLSLFSHNASVWLETQNKYSSKLLALQAFSKINYRL